MRAKPRIILGLLTFGPPGTESYGTRNTSLDDFNACLDYLQGRGYNEVDTARTYVNGQQEAWSKSARWRERGLTLATKWGYSYPPTPGNHAAQMLRAKLDTSLAELGTDCVEIFYLHAPDRSTPYEETLRTCNELFLEGKFKRLGVSNYAAWEVAELWNIANERGWVRPSIYQAMYNAFTRAIEDELIPCCQKYGIDIAGYNPLAGGMLSGKYKSNEVPTEGRFAEVDSIVGKQYRARYFKDANFEALNMVEPVAKEFGLTLPEIALRWYVHHSKLKILDGNDGIVIGVSSLKQLESNITDLEKGPLPDQIVQVLDQAWEKVTKPTCDPYWR